MAVWVQQDTIVHVVWPSQGTPDDVMVVPSCDLGDFLVTDGADAVNYKIRCRNFLLIR